MLEFVREVWQSPGRRTMGKYGEVAITATRCFRTLPDLSPVDAWKLAVKISLPNSEAGQNKACPKGAFLGLCEEGIVKGVPIGQYTRSKKNKEYAIAAYHLLTEYQRLAANEEELWQRVTERKGVRQNQQMDVVLSLWKHDRLAR
jgi:hypothetical protein